MKKLKTPSDYPQFYFRVSDADKRQIEDLISVILEVRLSKWQAGTIMPKRNEIIIEALKIGLIQLNKKGIK